MNPVAGADGGGWRDSSAAPLSLLLLALATVFLFGGGRGHFNYLDEFHNEVTLNYMMVAQNLSPEHDFLGFYHLYLDDAGEPAYRPYNRFPVLGYALIKLATLPFPDDISARLSAARMLMLAFFAAAAALAHLALCRLTRSRWAALAATLLSFSSYYALYYNDMVATEGVIDLFALMLVLHGMAAFATEGRFGQLLAKTCAALLLGWHPYALLMPFVLLGLAAALRRRDGLGVRRHLTLGAVALAFGSLVLAANFTREWAALGGETPAAELPSVQSMLHRTGIAPRHPHPFNWTGTAEEQLGRIGAALVPYALSHFIINGKPGSRGVTKVRIYVALGSVLSILTVLACLAQFLFTPPHSPLLPLTALALSGPCWVVAVRYSAFMPHEGVFYVGIPLAFFALLLPRLDRLHGGRVRFSVLAGVAAVPIFALSSFLMARSSNPAPGYVAYARAVAADVDSIRKLVQGKTISVSDVDACSRGRYRPLNLFRPQTAKYYFTGSVFVDPTNRHLADFVVSERLEGARSLTPSHRRVFLYDRVNYDAALGWYQQQAKHGAPVLESPDWEVHLVKGSAGRHLFYFDDHCPDHQIRRYEKIFLRIIMGGSHVFLHTWPADANDLPAGRRQFGFDDLVNFRRALPGWRKDGGCYVLCRLPDYSIARIHTGWATEHWTSKGRQHDGYDVIWEGSFSPDSDQAPKAGLPAAPPRPSLQPMAQQE